MWKYTHTDEMYHSLIHKNELYHYGVLGMKWGVTKAKSTSPNKSIHKKIKNKKIKKSALINILKSYGVSNTNSVLDRLTEFNNRMNQMNQMNEMQINMNMNMLNQMQEQQVRTLNDMANMHNINMMNNMHMMNTIHHMNTMGF